MIYNKQKEIVLNQCIEDIIGWFLSDSIELFDAVLDDDQIDPQYSANTAYRRLEKYVLFQRLNHNDNVQTVEELLINSGYTEEDIINFRTKLRAEAPRYYRDNLPKAAFDVLSVGQSLQDVKAVDPDTNYIMLNTDRDGIPRKTKHYTCDGYMIEIIYDDNDLINNIKIKLI